MTLLALCCPALLTAQPPTPVLSKVIDVHRLPSARAAASYPVRLSGVVTQVMPEWRGFSLQDSSDAIYVAAPNDHSSLPLVGQRVEVDGHSKPGNFAAMVQADSIRLLGAGQMPKPALADWKYLSTGACDNAYVEVSGTVRSVEPVQPPRWRWRATAMRIDLGGNLMWAYIRDPTGLPKASLPGAIVRVRGTCVVLSNARHQFERNALLVASGGGVDVVEARSQDPFSLPISNMDHLFTFRPGEGATARPVRVEGTVTWTDGVRLFLQNGQSSLQVRTTNRSEARVGQCLDVVGFPAPGAYSTLLEDAIIAQCSQPQRIAPLDVTASEILSRTKENRPALPDGMIVALGATVLDVSRSAQEQILTLSDHDSVFAARLVGRPQKRGLAIQEGSRIRVSGVCVIQVDDLGLPRSFEVLLRSPADVEVTATPSWVTRSIALRIVIILLATALLGLLWIFLLRRRVRSQMAIIEEQLKREAALETRLRDLVDHASDMVYILDLDGHLLHVNYGVERLTGYTQAELLHRPIFDLIVPEQRALARQSLARDAFPESTFRQAEWRLLRKDGREITVEINDRLQVDVQGEIRVQAIGRDVTARKQAMFEDQERFRTLANNIPQLAWMADANGSMTWYNQRWFEYTGSRSDEVLDWGWVSYHHPDYVERVVTNIRHSFETGEPWEDSFPLRGRDGQFRWFLGLAVPIHDADGRIVRWFGTNTDITEQKQIESALQRSNDDLRQFAYVASHDLQEPLRNVCTFAQMLARSFHNGGELSPQRSKYIEVITSGARRMETLITDLLVYTRAAGTQVIERPATDMQAVFNDARANLEVSIRQSSAVITQDPLPTIHANPAHLAQVLQNLLGNAIKYRRSNVNLAIHVGASRQAAGWLFSVRDNGSGFEPGYADRIFGIFKRLHGSEVPGTGIGLAICRTVIERHGGRIWAEGELGVGATFFFTIPDSFPATQTTSSPKAVVHESGQRSGEIAGMKVGSEETNGAGDENRTRNQQLGRL